MSFFEQMDTDDAPETDVEQALRAYYQREFERFGDAPAIDTQLARLAPILSPTLDTPPDAGRPRAVDPTVAPTSGRRWTGAG